MSEIRKMVTEGETALAEVRAAGEMALQEARFRRQGPVTACLAFLVLALPPKVSPLVRARKPG